jgi:hypothetical protein
MTLTEKSRSVLRALAKLSKESTLSLNELRVVIALERIVAPKSAPQGERYLESTGEG